MELLGLGSGSQVYVNVDGIPPRDPSLENVPKALPRQVPLNERQALADATKVLDWLYLGGQQAASSRAALSKLGITHVLNCCERVPFASNKTQNMLLHVYDTKQADILPVLNDAFNFLDDVRACAGCCLVHCLVGASRSVTV